MYYHHMFKKEEDRRYSSVITAIDQRVTPEMSEALMKSFTATEVVESIKQMHPA